MILTLITPPQPAVTLVEAKEHLRVDHQDDDFLVQRLIEAAHARVQREAGYLYGAQTWEAYGTLTRDFLPDAGPVTGITSVLDDSGSAVAGVTLSGGWFTASPWPAGSVRIRYTAGHDVMPEDLRCAMFLLIGHWYEHRNAAGSDKIEEHALASTALIALNRRTFC